jgi:tRNA-modifying protein YgfZ
MDSILTDRSLFEIRGEDIGDFLQGLVTNDVRKLDRDAPLYAALLTPQGKILHDFLLYRHGLSILLDCASSAASDLTTRLLRYKLRAKVDIAPRHDLTVLACWNGSTASEAAWRDPRHPALGWRIIQDAGAVPKSPSVDPWLDHRLSLGIPEGADFGSDRMFALDADLDELHGVSFDKGCYVGQELTARMKHRGTARKRLLPVESESTLPLADAPIMAAEREVGVITSTYGKRGFATIRLDRLAEAGDVQLDAAGVPVRVCKPEWLFP